MKWRRLRPGRKTLARRVRAVKLANAGALWRNCSESAHFRTMRVVFPSFSNQMSDMDRRQWRRYERKRKRAGL